MKTFSSLLKQYSQDERGATAIEYGLLIALIGLGIVGGATFLGETLNENFVEVEGKFPT